MNKQEQTDDGKLVEEEMKNIDLEADLESSDDSIIKRRDDLVLPWIIYAYNSNWHDARMNVLTLLFYDQPLVLIINNTGIDHAHLGAHAI